MCSLSETWSENHVIKLSEKAVVKFGKGVKKEEAISQSRAYDLIDSNILRVPAVYRFFTIEQRGYIVMEYMLGRILQPTESPVMWDRITRTLTYLTTIHNPVPGALDGGVSSGILWSEHSEEPYFSTIEDLENWFNRRLLKEPSRLIFGRSDVVLCHLDIAPRNIRLQQDGTLCLLDWSSAGFYPRVFEECALQITSGLKGSFSRSDIRLEGLTDEEEAQVQLMLKAWSNSVRFCFRNTRTPCTVKHLADD